MVINGHNHTTEYVLAVGAVSTAINSEFRVTTGPFKGKYPRLSKFLRGKVLLKIGGGPGFKSQTLLLIKFFSLSTSAAAMKHGGPRRNTSEKKVQGNTNMAHGEHIWEGARCR